MSLISIITLGFMNPASAAYQYESWSGFTAGTIFLDGHIYGNWKDQFNGGGTTEVFNPGTLITTKCLSEWPAYVYGSTRSTMVTSTTAFSSNNFYAYSTFVTLSQNRPSPNSWEMGWFVWDYTDNAHFYNVILRTDGWELDKEDPAYPGNQRFLTSGFSPTFALDSVNTISVTQSSNVITVNVNGNYLTSYTDMQRPYYGGKIGLYDEDSHVAWGVTAASSN